MALFARGSDDIWPWEEVAERVRVLYQARGADQRFRTALVIWQGDDPRVELASARPDFVVCTLDVDAEPGTDNAISIRGFGSLEEARAACVEWVGEAREAPIEELPETAQIGIYATLRNPSFATDA